VRAERAEMRRMQNVEGAKQRRSFFRQRYCCGRLAKRCKSKDNHDGRSGTRRMMFGRPESALQPCGVGGSVPECTGRARECESPRRSAAGVIATLIDHSIMITASSTMLARKIDLRMDNTLQKSLARLRRVIACCMMNPYHVSRQRIVA